MSTISGDVNSEQVQSMLEKLLSLFSSLLSLGGAEDFFSEIDLTMIDELTVALVVLLSAYLVIRPLAAAFRVKRILFNLGEQSPALLHRTTVSWHLTRSVGLYEAERLALAKFHAKPQRELPLDLCASLVAVGALAWYLWSEHFFIAESAGAEYGLFAIAAALVFARIGWLISTLRLRRGATAPASPPTGIRIPNGAIAESRSVIETSVRGLATFLVFLVVLTDLPFFIPSPIWGRLVRERREMEQSVGGQRCSQWPALLSSVVFWVLPSLALWVHLTRLARLQPSGFGPVKRARAWLVPLTAVGTLVIAADVFWVYSILGGALQGVSFALNGAIYAVTFAVVQREHNTVAASLGTPLPFDDTFEAVPTVYAPWAPRALAATVDLIPVAALFVMFVEFASCATDPAAPYCTILVGFAAKATLSAVFVGVATYCMWNWWYRQSRTGATVGKSIMKIGVVRESTGLPVGFGRSAARSLLYVVNLLPAGLGFLAPIWDAKGVHLPICWRARCVSGSMLSRLNLER